MPPQIDIVRPNAPFSTDALVIGMSLQRGALHGADRATADHVKQVIGPLRFSPDLGEILTLPAPQGAPFGSLIVAGLGDTPNDDETLRRAAAEAAKTASRFERVGLSMASEGKMGSVLEGFLMGLYSFDRHLSNPSAAPLEQVVVRGVPKATVDRARTFAETVHWVRDLVNEPPGSRGPHVFADAGQRLAEEAGVQAEVFEVKALQKMGMNGILRVGAGSEHPPCLLTLRYQPRGAKRSISLVGKGITFDSGGLSLKDPEPMETMKTDCSGGAAVVGAITAAARLGLKVAVTAAVPLAENMPSGSAMRPGDVIRHYGGRTSEVLNTDAEGRLVLADALAWAAEQNPEMIVDIATLTGGMVIALGKKTGGYFANRPDLARRIERASQRSGEPIWRMPLSDELRPLIDSDVADSRNRGGRWGGPIIGALFLSDFVNGTPWAHLDIAGPARSEEDSFYFSKGATGYGTRLLICLLEDLARS